MQLDLLQIDSSCLLTFIPSKNWIIVLERNSIFNKRHRVAVGFSPPASTTPSKRVRTARFPEALPPLGGNNEYPPTVL